MADSLFNRPPSISEDALQYTIYPRSESSDRISATTIAVAIQSFVDSVLADFIWHRDPFQIKVVKNPEGDDAWMLEGLMRVGDSIDDEWCTVWLLREISAKWDLAISVYDSDGEFLLIEAAESLPKWVSPSNAENRVWIYKSHLHLIPLSHVSPPSTARRRRRLPGTHDSDDEGEPSNLDEDDFLSTPDALKLVWNPNVPTNAPVAVENAVWQRIQGYPSSLKSHSHTAKAYVPVDIAKALSADPSLVQKAVETFYTRDAIQLRAAHKMSRFPPQPSVLRDTKMTRTAYAQLVGQKFHPPKIFGQWREKEGTQEWRWKDVGMKIACGFEMLYQESKGRAESFKATLESIKSSDDARKDALRRDPEYVKYIQNLVSAGYFKGEIEGSQLWNTLEDNAVEVFIQTRREDDASRPSFAVMVNTAVLKATPDALEPSLSSTEESDDWLNVNAEDFDTMLEQKLGKSKGSGPPAETNRDAMDVDKTDSVRAEEDRQAKEQASRLNDLAKKVETFLDGKGDVEGAKFEDEESSGEEEMSDFSDEKFSDSGSDSGSDDEMDGAARQAAMDKLVPALDPSEYGKMPASYHSNSQRVAPATVDSDIVADEADASATASGAVPPQKPTRPPILLRDKYDGVDSDDETDEEEDLADGEDDEDDERPQVVGDIEIDMGEEEEEFLEFSRQALGITDEQWGDILRDRKSRGAFVPSHVVTESRPTKPASSSATAGSAADAKEPKLRTPMPGPRPNANPNLDSFEAVMQAMDAELARSKAQRTHTAASKPPTAPSGKSDKGKGKAKADEFSLPTMDESEDIDAAMDAELRAALRREEDDGDVDVDAEMDEGAGMDYNLIKNFLESFKSQGGLSGPVSNLAGRLQPGWNLPRDES